MILVDTDHLSEQLRGWLAQIRRARTPQSQIAPYLRLAKLLDFLAGWNIVDWDASAVAAFEELRGQRIRIGTQDLKIASIARANNALLLSANLRDFGQVPGLRVEDWLYD